MKWTKDKPTVPGWYWYQHKSSVIRIGEVFIATRGRSKGKLLLEGFSMIGDYKWAGPIAEPEE